MGIDGLPKEYFICNNESALIDVSLGITSSLAHVAAQSGCVS